MQCDFNGSVSECLIGDLPFNFHSEQRLIRDSIMISIGFTGVPSQKSIDNAQNRIDTGTHKKSA